MSGEELDRKLKDAGYVMADIARLLGVPPQSINQSLNAKDIKTGFLEDLCRVLGKDMSFFYGAADGNSLVNQLRQENSELKNEIRDLKRELSMYSNPDEAKNGKIYKLWMKFMDITAEMQEMYKEEKEG
jgi:transcriptional regulator with XRE-family HTH domain